MSTFDEQLKQAPRALLKINDSGTIEDVSGNQTNIAGSYSTHVSISNGSMSSYISDPASPLNIDTSLFSPGAENNPFSIYARFLETTNNDSINQSIVSHQGKYDGLAIIGNEIRFTIDFNTLGSTYVSYTMPDKGGAISVVANYLVEKLQLYVNGVLVGQTEISAEQINDGFAPVTSTRMFIGHNSTSNFSRTVVLDNIAIYSPTLNESKALTMHLSEHIDYQPWDNHWAYATTNWKNRNYFNHVSFSRLPDWLIGNPDSIGITDEGLAPLSSYDTGLSIPGEWTYNYEVASSGSSIYGIQVDWQGHGDYEIVYSDDDFVTETVLTYPGQNVPNTYGVDGTLLQPSIKVRFLGGQIDDSSVVNWIMVRSYLNEVVDSTNYSRSFILQDNNSFTDMSNEGRYLDFSDGSGVVSTGAILLSSDAEVEAPIGIRSIEFSIMFTGSVSGITIADTRPGGGTGYLYTSGTSLSFNSGVAIVNGEQVTSGNLTILPNRIYHIVYVVPSDHLGTVTLPASSRQIYFFNMYSYALTEAEAKRFLLTMSGSRTYTTVATDSISMSDSNVSLRSSAWGMTFIP